MTRHPNPDTVPEYTGTPSPGEVHVRLLNIGLDRELLCLRGWYLSSLGFEVVDTLDPASVGPLLQSDAEFEMVLLCHTLGRSEKLRIESCVQQDCAEADIVELYLTDLPVTCGIGVEATTEFQLLMRTIVGQDFAAKPHTGDSHSIDLGRRWQRLQPPHQKLPHNPPALHS